MIGIVIALLSLDVLVRGKDSLALSFYYKYVAQPKQNTQAMDSRYS